MDLEKVTNRVNKIELIKRANGGYQIAASGGYQNVEEFFEELLLVFENATTYNEPGSIIYQDALILHKVAIDALNLGEKSVLNLLFFKEYFISLF